jgi:hypothetical protein
MRSTISVELHARRAHTVLCDERAFARTELVSEEDVVGVKERVADGIVEEPVEQPGELIAPTRRRPLLHALHDPLRGRRVLLVPGATRRPVEVVEGIHPVPLARGDQAMAVAFAEQTAKNIAPG